MGGKRRGVGVDREQHALGRGLVALRSKEGMRDRGISPGVSGMHFHTQPVHAQGHYSHEQGQNPPIKSAVDAAAHANNRAVAAL